MRKEKPQGEVIVSKNPELSDQLILYIPGIGVKTQDLERNIRLFQEGGEDLKVLDFDLFLKKEGVNSQKVFDEINSIVPEGKKIDYLIGYSLGGGVALDYVNNYPDKVQNLVLIDPYVFKSNNYGSLFFRRVMDAFLFQKSEGSKIKNIFGFFFKYSRRISFMLKEIRLINQFKLFDSQNKIENKTYFLWGKEDKTCPMENYELISDNFSNKIFIEIPNNDHDWNSDLALFGKYIERTGIFK